MRKIESYDMHDVRTHRRNRLFEKQHFFSVAVSLLRPSNYFKRSNGRYRLNMGKSYVTEDESINYETMLRDNRRNS